MPTNWDILRQIANMEYISDQEIIISFFTTILIATAGRKLVYI